MTAARRGSLALVVAGGLALGGCAFPFAARPAPTVTVTAPPAETTSAPSGAPRPSASPVATLNAPTPEATATAPPPAARPPQAPSQPQTLQLAPGQTAHLAHFDVTFVEFTHGKDGISAGWKVRTCYTRPHPQQNPDGTTRVSTDPWRVRVRDGEGGGDPKWVAFNEFERDRAWAPDYPTTRLALGQCQLGWLGMRHGNPDLIFDGLRYAPADFGDVVTWAH